jgi:hypothetical protein
MALASGAVAPAWANAPPENREQAKRLRNAGADAMDRGDFPEALELFRQAFRLYPSPNSRYNVGVALDRLGRSSDAVEAFEGFLAEASNAPKDAREFAQHRVKELLPRIGRLTFVVSPTEAVVAFDGQPISLPRARDLPVMPGEHEVTAELKGYMPSIVRIAIGAGDVRRVDVTLQPIIATERASHPATTTSSAKDGTAPPPVDVQPPQRREADYTDMVEVVPHSEHKPESRPQLYRKWWLWTIVGATFVGVVATAVALTVPQATQSGFKPTLLDVTATAPQHSSPVRAIEVRF